MKDDYTVNSYFLTNTFLLRKVGRMYFLSLGVKGLNLLGVLVVAEQDARVPRQLSVSLRSERFTSINTGSRRVFEF